MQAKFPIMPESLMQMQISQLSWECASHSLGDINMAWKKCSRLGRESHSIVKELKLLPAYP